MTVDFEAVPDAAAMAWHGGGEKAFHLFVSYPYDFSPKVNDPENYSVALFRHDHLKESDIREIYNGNARRGFFIPLQAIGSNDHDYADNPYFSIYAGRVLERICDDPQFQNARKELAAYSTSNDAVDLDEILGDTVGAVCVYRPSMLPGEHIESYIPSFLRQGLLPYQPGKHECTWIGGFSLAEERKLVIRPSCVYPVMPDELKNTLISVIPRQTDPVVQFFLIYQFVEWFIQCVFASRGRTVFSRIRAIENPTVQQVREFVDEISRISSEKTRIKDLFAACEGDAEDRAELRDHAKKFLKACGVRTKREETPYLLYLVRNQVVHNSYRITEDARESLKLLVECFFLVCMGLCERADKGIVSD